MSLRYPDKFTSIDGSLSFTFPVALASMQVEQNWRSPVSSGVGANYVHDHLGYGVSPRDPRLITVRGMIVGASNPPTPTEIQTIMDEAQSEIHRIGLGYLYRLDVDGSTYRRCLARAVSAPSITFDGTFQFGATPFSVTFRGQSDWMAVSADTGSQTITAYQTSVTVTNEGNIPVFSGIVFTLTALTADGFSNVVIRNVTNGSQISSTRDSVAIGSVLQIGNPDGFVGYQALPSLVVGMAGRHVGAAAVGPDYFANDYGLASLGTTGFIYLNPGANQLIVESDGTPNFTFAWSFYDAYA